MESLNTKETGTATFYTKEGVVYVQYKKNVSVQLEDVQINFKVRQEIQNDTKMLVLVNVSDVWEFSDEARKFVGKSKLESLTTAMAVITGQSMPIRLVANLFLKINKPTYPTLLFKSKRKALEWLKSFL